MTVSLVVGAGGFVGRHLSRYLSNQGADARFVSSRASVASWRDLDLGSDEAALAAGLAGIDRVFFVAGAAHEAGRDAEDLHRLNVRAPLRWLEAADRAGVGTFVWLSSIKVLGDVSAEPLTPEAPYRPGDGYARSKVEAEQRLLGVRRAHTALAVVRPPLVYGPEVRANFRHLLQWADSGVPLPLAGATALRSLVCVDNLCSLLTSLGPGHGGVHHVADADDVSVAELITEMRRALDMPPRLFRLPPAVLQGVARGIGRWGWYSRLFEPLRVDQTATMAAVGWTPPVPRQQALADTVSWFRTSH